ncbi:hypothetical protein OPT61_g5422 [Boeremia exigua]|uniref:Uncharacterized protein n=1 Tax=Boeremia exigua TaxID=749465 RepID=A0ACC2IAC8_9PLEO|nr:hypothetical protein OPT61_g5422 [Boeremia exigua]
MRPEEFTMCIRQSAALLANKRQRDHTSVKRLTHYARHFRSQTRLRRPHVQRLIQHFLSHIAFQYYPLDLEITSNPFVVSWWPLALADPALFHVSLQTASLDLDLQAQKGFANSEILMADSVSLVRQKIADPTSALQDETLDSIITLAAIEYGKGNTDVSALHVDGVKRLVKLRGGINNVKRMSPLTARMVAWVCMVVTQTPQFSTQNDDGSDEAIAPIPQWHQATGDVYDLNPVLLKIPLLEADITDILCRLHSLFDSDQHTLSSNDLHDLTCYAVHRLLLWSPQPQSDGFPCDLAASGIVRHALVLYLLIIHGPTYFSHARLQYATALKLQAQMEYSWFNMLLNHGSLALWLFSIGMIASEGTPEGQWFVNQARTACEILKLQTWDDVVLRLREIVWLDSRAATHSFRQKWQEKFYSANEAIVALQVGIYTSTSYDVPCSPTTGPKRTSLRILPLASGVRSRDSSDTRPDQTTACCKWLLELGMLKMLPPEACHSNFSGPCRRIQAWRLQLSSASPKYLDLSNICSDRTPQTGWVCYDLTTSNIDQMFRWPVATYCAHSGLRLISSNVECVSEPRAPSSVTSGIPHGWKESVKKSWNQTS